MTKIKIKVKNKWLNALENLLLVELIAEKEKKI